MPGAVKWLGPSGQGGQEQPSLSPVLQARQGNRVGPTVCKALCRRNCRDSEQRLNEPPHILWQETRSRNHDTHQREKENGGGRQSEGFLPFTFSNALP